MVPTGSTSAKTVCWTAGTGLASPVLATDARYKFTDGANEWFVWRSQRRAPDDFRNAGVDWEGLGTFTCTSGTLVIELSDLANGAVCADAIRIEQVGTGATFIDDGDPGYSEVGPWGAQSGPFLGFNQDTHGINPAAPGNGTGANTATWTFNVDPGYVYELAACWLHYTNRATNARYKLRDQVGAVVQNEWWRFVGQKNAPNQFDDQGEDWRVLDTFSITGDGLVFADAIRLMKKELAVEVTESGGSTLVSEDVLDLTCRGRCGACGSWGYSCGSRQFAKLSHSGTGRPCTIAH